MTRYCHSPVTSKNKRFEGFVSMKNVLSGEQSNKFLTEKLLCCLGGPSGTLRWLST